MSQRFKDTDAQPKNLYLFFTQDKIIRKAKKRNNVDVNLLPIFISKEAVEYILEAEALACGQYELRKDFDADAKKRYEAHIKLVYELSEIRNVLNP